MKLAYVVTEAGCMDPTTGAYQHIAMGLHEFGKHADIISFVPLPPRDLGASPIQVSTRFVWCKWLKKTGAWGTLRDIRDIARMLGHGLKLTWSIKRSGCKAAYVRVQALHPISLLLRGVGIKVFLEANGLQHITLNLRAPSWISWAYKPFERQVYRAADHVFFVGSYGDYWELDTDNWTEVENGIEPNLLTPRKETHRESRPLRIVLLARLVAHHRGDFLSDAIIKMDKSLRDQAELHLVGSGFGSLKNTLHKHIRVLDHGFVPRDGIGNLLKEMDVGVIPDCPPYGSQMKLFDYAASGCLVVAPNVHHLVKLFGDKGVLFFVRNDRLSLSNTLEMLIRGDVNINDMTKTLTSHIVENFMWDRIFSRKWQIIQNMTLKEA